MNSEERDVCICNGNASGTMICCNSCNNWYHCEWLLLISISIVVLVSMRKRPSVWTVLYVNSVPLKILTVHVICLCHFVDVGDDEEEYVFEKEESPKRKRLRSTGHKAFSFSSDTYKFQFSIDGLDGLCGAVEEMNERSVLKAICTIEQKLLFEDTSPSVHCSTNRQEVSHTEVELMVVFDYRMMI